MQDKTDHYPDINSLALICSMIPPQNILQYRHRLQTNCMDARIIEEARSAKSNRIKVRLEAALAASDFNYPILDIPQKMSQDQLELITFARRCYLKS